MKKNGLQAVSLPAITGRKRNTKNNAKAEADPDFMASLAKGLAVMQTFSQHKRHLSVSQISAQTGFSRAAVRRCMHTLTQLGFAGSQDQQHFFLRAKVLSLSQGYFSSTPLAKIAQPILEELSRRLYESCSVATLEDFEVIYIARAAVSRIMSVDLRVGSRLPAFCTSMGRVLLTGLPAEQLNTFFNKAKLTRHTNRTVTSISELRQVLDNVKRTGYAMVDQELEVGLRSLAVPIHDKTGTVVAALNIGCHAPRVSIREMQTRFLPALRKAAVEIGGRL
jgi:IclR family pca regulon transcriptional regulator